MKPLLILASILLLMLFETHHVKAYRKYYIEDECISPDEYQKVFFRLPQTGPDSVGEMRSNRFGTYSKTGRNCLIKLLPPTGFGVIVTVLRVDFRNHEGCKDYIKIFADDEDGEKLCGFKNLGLDDKTYFSSKEIKILYHTAKGGMGFSNGFRLIFTVTKLDKEECSEAEEFQCQNSHCIWAGVTCDGINNCGDGSDENSTDHPHCSTYQQLYKSFFTRLAEVTPIAIAAVILGVTSFIAVLILMCLCCCRPQPPSPYKVPLPPENVPLRSTVGYIPLPGYTYGAIDQGIHYQQPFHSAIAQAPAPVGLSTSCQQNPHVPYVQQKVEIMYNRPPPPYVA